MTRRTYPAILALVAGLTGTACFSDQQVDGMQEVSALLRDVGGLDHARAPGKIGDKCDYSYDTWRCEKGLYCDRGVRVMTKMADGRVGIMGACAKPPTSEDGSDDGDGAEGAPEGTAE